MKRLFENNNTFTQNKYNKVIPCWFLINDYPCIFIDNYRHIYFFANSTTFFAASVKSSIEIKPKEELLITSLPSLALVP